MTEETVLASVDGRVGRIRLNRPNALHALDLEMCERMIDPLLSWRDERRVEAVIIDHASGRGFCAGGDVRAVAAGGAADAEPAS